MTMKQRWIELIRAEYLDGYISEGGSALKIIVSSDSSAQAHLAATLTSASNSAGLLPILLDARSTKLHFIHLLFNEMARQIDWTQLARAFLTRCFERLGASAPFHFPTNLNVLAQSLGTTRSAIADDLMTLLRLDLVDDHSMSHEFKAAFLTLCLGQIQQSDGLASPHASVVARWLRGEPVSLPELKAAGLFQRVARHNARYLLVSLAHMIRMCGHSGLLLSLDISRYLESVRPSARLDGHYYSPAAVVDLYEMLRQLIDEQGILEGVFTVVWAPLALISDPGRGLDRYQALKMRVFDDVRARSHPNLLAPLVRL